jgi:hypothetical protein
MARIDGLEDEQATFMQRFVFRTAARQSGAVPNPLRIMARSPAVMWAASLFQIGFDRARTLQPRHKDLACLKAASMIGCVF